VSASRHVPHRLNNLSTLNATLVTTRPTGILFCSTKLQFPSAYCTSLLSTDVDISGQLLLLYPVPFEQPSLAVAGLHSTHEVSLYLLAGNLLERLIFQPLFSPLIIPFLTNAAVFHQGGAPPTLVQVKSRAIPSGPLKKKSFFGALGAD
jgi:hypothetical protein